MSWLGALFGGTGEPDPVPESAPSAAGFPARARAAADALAAETRRLGRDLSPAAASTLRRIPDILAPVIADAADHSLLPEREYAVESLLTDLVPTTITTYLRIPAAERRDGSAPDIALIGQLETLALSAIDIVDHVRRDAHAAFEANQIFLDGKFA